MTEPEVFMCPNCGAPLVYCTDEPEDLVSILLHTNGIHIFCDSCDPPDPMPTIH